MEAVRINGRLGRAPYISNPAPHGPYRIVTICVQQAAQKDKSCHLSGQRERRLTPPPCPNKMADSPALVEDAEEPSQLTASFLEPYNDDLLPGAALISSFDLIPASGTLASSGRSDDTADPLGVADEDHTYASLISHARVRAALKRPLRLTSFYRVPAAVLVLELQFFDTQQSRQLPRLLRFKAVDVTVEFKDADPSPRRSGPEVLMFCPKTYVGEPTLVRQTAGTTITGSVGLGGGLPVGAKLSLQREWKREAHRAEACSVTGRTLLRGGRAKMIVWEAREDGALKRGVPKQLRLVAAVTIPEERAFEMKLNFSAALGFGDLQFKVKKEKRVLATRIDPKALREQALNHEHGPEFGRIWQCLVDDMSLEQMNLEELTDLKGATVGKTSGF